MRLFFLVLLLANLAAWFWRDDVAAWLAPRLEPAPAPVAKGEPPPPLVLLAERDGRTADGGAIASLADEPAPSAAPPSAGEGRRARHQDEAPAAAAPPPARTGAATRSDTASVCVEIGPWTDGDHAADARAAAEQAGMTARLVREERETPTGYWVLSPARYDLAGARAAMRELEGQGIQDLAIVSLDDGHAVSLGIFSRASAMERRRRELTDIGHPPDVRRRSETRPVELLVIERSTADDAAIEALLERLAREDPALQWRERPCEPLL